MSYRREGGFIEPGFMVWRGRAHGMPVYGLNFLTGGGCFLMGNFGLTMFCEEMVMLISGGTSVPLLYGVSL